jgi:hypothetical protein
MLLDFTIGRKGFLGYLKALAGSNVVKVVPAPVDASGAQVNGHKKLKVVCGANTSYLDDGAWVGDKTPMTLAEVRVSPNNSIKPNIGSLELAEALTRVLPFTARDDNRPVLQSVLFMAKEGKLKLVSADGFRLAVVTLDYDGEGQALINREDLRGIANALRKAKRVALSFEKSGESLDGMSLIIDTELIRYKWRGIDGNYPDYEKLIPTEFNTLAHFDTVEAIKAITSLKALKDWIGKDNVPAIDLTIGNGKIVLTTPFEKGQTEVNADTNGEGYVRLDGNYLVQALKACGGMVDFKLTNSYSPTLFTTDGYQLVVMPMGSDKATEQAKRDREAREAEAQAEPTTTEQAKPAVEGEIEIGENVSDVARAIAETVINESKGRVRKRKAKEPVAV